jgi:hypothetical protein
LLSSNRYLKIIVSLIAIQLFLFKNTFCQNLIRNGSFENISPPQNWNNWSGEFITFSQTPSQRVLLDWDEEYSSDLFTTACTHTWSGVPVNVKGYCQPKNGSSYVGFMLFGNGLTNDGKEYIYQQLTSPLQAGKIYCLSFFVSRADRKEYAIENIGAYFSNNVQTIGSIGYINKTPQVVNQNGIITDTINWVQIQGCFTANGGEQYITIGNFNTDANTNSLYVGTNNPIPSNPEFAYYYIDDITLIDQTTVGIDELGEESFFSVYPNPANDILNIDIKNFNKENLSVNIVDVIGKEVLKSDYKNQIDVSFLEKGIYFVSIQQDRKTLGVKKIIKE